MRVLVADDDLVSRLMLQGAVEGLGHECVVAEDGDEAWRLFVERPSDVLITDRVMPGMDGLELCRRIRAAPDESYTYIILATVLSERYDVVNGMEAGADDYLTKPLNPFDLATRLIAAKRVTSLHAQLGRYRDELARLACTDPLTRCATACLSTTTCVASTPGAGATAGTTTWPCATSTSSRPTRHDGPPGRGRRPAPGGQGPRRPRPRGRHGVPLRRRGVPGRPARAGPRLATVPAERLRRAVEELGIDHPSGMPPGVVTISVGIAAFDPVCDTTDDELLERADVALYQAKQAGRNRVVIAAGDRDAQVRRPEE